MARVRPGEMLVKIDADSLYDALAVVDKDIMFSPRYVDSVGVRVMIR